MYSRRESLNIQSAKIGGCGITIKTIDNCSLQLNSSIFCKIDVFSCGGMLILVPFFSLKRERPH